MDQVALKALEVDPMQLMVIGMGLLALAIVTLAYFNSRSTNNLVAVMQSQVNQNGKMTETQSKQTDVLGDFRDELRRDRELRERQGSTLTTVRESLTTHDQRSDERSEKLLQKIDGITDLIGTKVSASADLVMGSMKPLIDALKEIKTSLESAREEAKTQQNKQAEILNGIETKVELVSEQIINVAQVIGEIEREEKSVVTVSDSPAGGDVSAGAAGGSAAANGTGDNGGLNGTADGASGSVGNHDADSQSG